MKIQVKSMFLSVVWYDDYSIIYRELIEEPTTSGGVTENEFAYVKIYVLNRIYWLLQV